MNYIKPHQLINSMKEEKMSILESKENYGLGPIIQIKSSRQKYRRFDGEKKARVSSLVYWGGFIFSMLLLACPFLIYKAEDDYNDHPGTMTGYGVSRPRWGIAGLGHIAHDFCAVLAMTGGNITAVAAGSLPEASQRAYEFATEFNIPSSYGNYEELAANPDVDIVYISTTNHLHFNVSMLMLNAGKHVLVEKPTAMSVVEARSMFALAKQKGLLLTTNYWTRYFPAFRYARKHVDEQAIGKIVAVRGDFGMQAPGNTQNRFFSSALGGGALFDFGCYLVQFATIAAPEEMPQRMQGMGRLAETGVDLEVSFALQWWDDVVVSADAADGPSWRPTDAVDANGTSVIEHTPSDRKHSIDGRRNDVANLVYVDSSLQWVPVGGTGRGTSPSTRRLRGNNHDVSAAAAEGEGEGEGELSSYTSLLPLEVSGDEERSAPGSFQQARRVVGSRGLTATFSSSLQRESLAGIEYLGEYGTITLVGPANAPSKVRVSISKRPAMNSSQETSFAGQPAVFEEELTYPMPKWPYPNKRQRYPSTTGFTYIIDAIESCLKSKGCRSMKEMSSDEQIRVTEILEKLQHLVVESEDKNGAAPIPVH